MVATLVRLKARILGHTLRRERWRLVVLIIGALWTLSLLPSVIGGMVWLSRQPPAAAADVLVVAGALLTVRGYAPRPRGGTRVARCPTARAPPTPPRPPRR